MALVVETARPAAVIIDVNCIVVRLICCAMDAVRFNAS